MKSQVAQIADMQVILERLEEQEHRRIQRISQFLDESDERDILILETLLTNRHNARTNGTHSSRPSSKSGPKTAKALNGTGNLPGREARNFGPLTSKGTPRQRAWGVLRPAIEQAIKELDEISSIAIYHHLKRQQFPFAAARPVPSIAAFLRMLVDEGVIKEAHPGSKKRPVVFVKTRKEQGAKKGSKKRIRKRGRLSTRSSRRSVNGAVTDQVSTS
jgi:hypothetical protein